jgi:hypothetical protein
VGTIGELLDQIARRRKATRAATAPAPPWCW